MAASTIEPVYRDIGRRIRKARKARRLSQSTLADSLGLSRTSIVMIERGQQRLLVHTLVEFARKLAISPMALLVEPANVAFDASDFLTSIHDQIKETRPNVQAFVIDTLTEDASVT